MEMRITGTIIIILMATVLMAQTVPIELHLLSEKSDRIGGEIFLPEINLLEKTNERGHWNYVGEKGDTLQVVIFAEGYMTQEFWTVLDFSRVYKIKLKRFTAAAETVEVLSNRADEFAKLRDVDGVGIYASKKSEIIRPSGLSLNLATNNPRQIYATVPGLNIWENDGFGLQLSIGARGLDPNRTANFNTRQNGMDMSADALGYPESYYSPPTEALKQIEIVRGAASLQYGPQFGGLLNFKLKDGDIDEKLKLDLNTTAGSYEFLNGFVSAEGKVGDVQYYSFFQRKQGQGWRENTQFHQNTGYMGLAYQVSQKLKLKGTMTVMNYLAQQPGGLQDFEFAQDPQLSNRSRNWFDVSWRLFGLQSIYTISESATWETRLFHLDANRRALGELGPINRPDPNTERDIIDGRYNNWGGESRFIQRYQWRDLFHHALVGVRYYHGRTRNRQGLGSEESDADFTFLNPNDVEGSSYTFPGQNVAVFAEHLTYLTKRWTLTPGIRWEYIHTASKGFYKNRVFAGNQLIFEERIEDQQKNGRQFVLLGLGSSFRWRSGMELYANYSQNYRSINFSDITILNPNLQIDAELQDERGYNLDLGLRGQLKDGILKYDISGFWLVYNNRIGLGEKIIEDRNGQRAVAFRTNIGNAHIVGLESYLEGNSKLAVLQGKDLNLQTFVNLSLIQGRYTDGLSSFIGNQVELVPPMNLRTGLRLKWDKWSLFYLFSYTQRHYSDASNAEWVSDATRGIIPSYWVQDVSLDFSYEAWKVSLSVNNIADRMYYTRRATGYPGPGIIPVDGRTIYLTLSHSLQVK